MAVRALMQSSDGTLWIGTIGNGLWTFRDGRLLRADTPGLLPSVTVLHLFEDAAHQIWIGTQAGLVRLTQTIIHVVPLPQPGDKDVEKVFREYTVRPSGGRGAPLRHVQGDTATSPRFTRRYAVHRYVMFSVQRTGRSGSVLRVAEPTTVRDGKTTHLLSPANRQTTLFALSLRREMERYGSRRTTG